MLMVRKYESLAEDSDFLFWSVNAHPQDVLLLSRWIGRINEMFPPERMTWPEWFAALENLNGDRHQSCNESDVLIAQKPEMKTEEEKPECVLF